MSCFGIVGARILTMAGDGTPAPGDPDGIGVAEALAVRDGRIAAVGSAAEIRREVGDGPVIDARGRTILPGFIDVHTHVEMTALSRHVWTDVRGRSREEILQTVTREAAARPAGEWIIAQGTFGQDLPSKRELDESAPEHCVAVRWSMHKFVLNSAALSAAGLDPATVAPPGVRFQKDADGALNGVIEEGWDLLPVPDPDPPTLSEALRETLAGYFLANGVTTVHEIGYTRAGIQALRRLAEDGQAPRLGVSLTVPPGHQPLVRIEDGAIPPFGPRLGSSRFWYHGFKIFMDGGRDGAFRSNGLGETADRWGLLTRLYPTLTEELRRAAEAGIQVFVHAIGDLSQEIAVSAVERVHEAFPELDHRIRVEHFFNESTGTELLERLVAAGGLAVPNPGFVFAEPDDPALRLPPGASKYALRTLLQVQGRIPGNSDTAGAQPFTTNPWFTMMCMLRLRNKNDVPVNEPERIGLAQALRAFTVDAAYATFAEGERGSLEPGKLADLAVIDQDPFEVPAEELDSVRTLATVIGGNIAHGSWEDVGVTG